ncbi:MAG: PaaI family thioesterase [Candidatus Binatia bacterium]
MTAKQEYAIESLFGEPASIDLVDHIPHCRYLGIEMVSAWPREATARVPYREELVGDPSRGVVFGGVITTLIDQTCGVATLCSLEELAAIATIDLRIDYLRAAEPGLDLVCRAECYKLTKHVAFLRAVAFDRSIDDPFASTVGTFMVGANPTEQPLKKLAEERIRAAGRK